MTAPASSSAPTVLWLDQSTVGCSSAANTEVVKAAALAAGMKASEVGHPILLIAPSEHEAEIKAHLDWWGYQMKAIQSKGDSTAWEIRPA